MKSLTLEEVSVAVSGELIKNGDAAASVNSVSIDTRTIKEGGVFIPIKGENFDGHNFINAAFEKGAVCCLSENKIEPPKDKAVIIVKDSRAALRDLAEYYRTLFNVKVVGITGSVGKTSVKNMLTSVLSQKYKVLKTEGNFNNEIGLPLTVFNITDEYEIVVLEMGMSGFGEIHNLAKVARPDIAVITNIGVSHISNLGGREGILKAKSEIFDYFTTKSIAALNADDDMLINTSIATKNSVMWYGIENRKGIYAVDVKSKGLDGVEFAIITSKGGVDVKLGARGKHMALNALAAASVGIALGVSLEDIKKGLESFEPEKMRMAFETGANNVGIINDAYNSSPVSAKAAIDFIAESDRYKTVILGDMLELGDFAPSMHKEVGEYAAKKGIDRIISIGEMAENVKQGAAEGGAKETYAFADKEEFFENGLRLIKDNSIVLLKASRGMKFEEIAERLKGGAR